MNKWDIPVDLAQRLDDTGLLDSLRCTLFRALELTSVQCFCHFEVQNEKRFDFNYWPVKCLLKFKLMCERREFNQRLLFVLSVAQVLNDIVLWTYFCVPYGQYSRSFLLYMGTRSTTKHFRSVASFSLICGLEVKILVKIF